MTRFLRGACAATFVALPLLLAACSDDADPAAATTTTTSTSVVPTSTSTSTTEPVDPRDPRVGATSCGATTLPGGEVADDFDLVGLSCEEAHAFAASWSRVHDPEFSGEGTADGFVCTARPGHVACVAENQTQAVGWNVAG